MQRGEVQGLALVLIDDGAVIHVAASGIRNAAREPLTTGTIMYGASFTKTAFARFLYDPGTRYGYSGEGFYIAQLVLEEALGLDVGREMQARVFDRFGMTRTSMQWRPDFHTDLADGFSIDGTPEPHDERSRVSAAGSMDTCIDDQARLWAGIVRGEGLTATSRAEMTRALVPIASAHQFPTLVPDTNPANATIGLAAGLGLVTSQNARGQVWFKGGHDESTGNIVLCIEREKRCLVLLSNDVRAERIYPDPTRAILGETRMPWTWEYSWLTPDAGRPLPRCTRGARSRRRSLPASTKSSPASV